MIDRGQRGPDPFLDWKLRLFFAGAVLLAAGMLLGYDVLALLAIVVLFGGMVLMVLSARHRRRAEEEARYAEDGVEEDGERP